MSMNVGGNDDEFNSTINTTPLVDIMLVVLIIFLITVPVAAKTVKLELPHVSNIALQTKPENIIISVDAEGAMYWNDGLLPDKAALLNKLAAAGAKKPQPEVHIRGDADARYEYVGRVVNYCQKAGIIKVGFLTLPVRA
jgi:biopolymer transport protein ExbD